MTTKVFKISPDKIAMLKETLLKKQPMELLPLTNPYESFRVKHSGGLIVGYTSGKIVANTTTAALLVGDAIRGIVTEDKDYSIIIGSDEAGKGEWLGPMTIAAVALDPTQATSLVAKGVMDSKQLSPKRIIELVSIARADSIRHHVVVIAPQRFNRLMEEVKDEGKNLNDMLAWGHATAIMNVYNQLSSERLIGRTKVIIDEFDKLKTERRLKRVMNLETIILEQRPRAEEETAVAAASILARAAWEEWVDKASKRLSVDLRSVSRDEARRHENVRLFAKVSYLHAK